MALGESNPSHIAFPRHKSVKPRESNTPPETPNLFTEQMYLADTMAEEDKPVNYSLNKSYDESSRPHGPQNRPHEYTFTFQSIKAAKGSWDTQKHDGNESSWHGNLVQCDSKPRPRSMSPQSSSINGPVSCQTRYDPGADNINDYQGTRGSGTELVVPLLPDKMEQPEVNFPSQDMEIYTGLAEYLNRDIVRSHAHAPLLIKDDLMKGMIGHVRKRRHSDSDILTVDDPTSCLSQDVILRSKLMRLSSDNAAPRETAKFIAINQQSQVPTKHQDINELDDRLQFMQRSEQNFRNGFENVYQPLDQVSYGEMEREAEVTCDTTGMGMTDDTRKSQQRYTSRKSLVKSAIRKNCCVVCEDLANGTFFGAVVCLPCKSFFIRCTKEGEPCFLQKCRGDCEIRSKLRNRCQYCRYKRCLAVGMTRKEKPESIQPVSGQELCKVCGDLANGIHFGVNTCEGCKKFFRRGLKEHQGYICKENKDCWLNPRNRNNCRYCRYQKCVRVGMSRTAIKMGRPRRINPIVTTDVIQTPANQVFHEQSQNVNRLVPKMDLTGDREQPSSHLHPSHPKYVDELKFAHQVSIHMMTSTQNQRLVLPDQIKRISDPQWTEFRGPEESNQFAIRSPRPQWVGDVPIGSSHSMHEKNGLSYNYMFDTSETSKGSSFEQKTEKNLFSVSRNPSQGHTVLEHMKLSQCSKKHFKQSPKLMTSAQLNSYPNLVTSPCCSASSNNIHNEPTNFTTNRIFCALPACSISCTGNNSIEHSNHPPNPKSVCASIHKMFVNKPHDVSEENVSSQKLYYRESEPISFSCHHEKVCNYIPLDHKISGQPCKIERPEALDLRVTVTCVKSLDKPVETKSQSQYQSIYETQPSAAENSLVYSKKNGAMSRCEDDKLWDGKPKVQSLPIAYAIHGNLIPQSPCPRGDDIVTNLNSHRSSANVVLSGKCRSSTEYTPKSNSNNSEKSFPSGKDQHHYREFQCVSLDKIQAASGDDSIYRGNSMESLMVAKQSCQEKGQSEADNFVQNADILSCRSQFSASYQDIQDSCEKSPQKLNPVMAPHSSSPTESRYDYPPRLISPTMLKTEDGEFEVLKIGNTEYIISNEQCNGTDIVKSTPNEMTKSFDPYSDESSFRLVNKIFIASDALSDLASTAPKKPHSSCNGSVADSNSDLKVFDALANDFCYSPGKINQHWKQIYDQGPLDDVLTEAEYNLIIDMVKDYERKIFLCDEVANKPSISMNVGDCWPSRGNDKYHWMCLQERIVRQTFAETHFLHKIADKLHVKDRGKLEDHSKFLGNTILMASCEWFDPVRKKFHFFWNWKLPQDHPLNPFHQRITRLGSRIFNLHMHRTEITLLSILNLFLPANEELEDTPQMIEKSRFILKLLSHYLCSMNIDPNERIPELLDVMPKVNHMSVWYSNLIKNMKTDPSSMDQTLQNLTKLASNILAKRESS